MLRNQLLMRLEIVQIWSYFYYPFFVILLNSTMRKENEKCLAPLCVEQTLNPERKDVIDQEAKNLGFYLNELLSLQYQVNGTLLINAILTDQFIKQSEESNGKNSSSQGSTLVSGKQSIRTDKNEKRLQDSNGAGKRKKLRGVTKYKQSKSQSQYEPSQEQQVLVQYKLSESKNVPKNYGKSILSFIRKNEVYTAKVLCRFGVNPENFHQFLSKFKNSINTIAQLRALWIQDNSNQFAKVLRIISQQYLRKHALGHIFNSRVENYGKHIKYRQKILKAIKKPEEFTQMKDF